MDRQHNGRKYVKSQYTEVVIKNRKEKTDKQYHGQKKRKDKKTKYTYNYIENYRFGNINNQRYIRKLRNGQQLLPN